MKRVFLFIALFACSLFISEAQAQEESIWEMGQSESETEFLAVAKKSKSKKSSLTIEQLLGSQSMQETGQQEERTGEGEQTQEDERPIPLDQEEEGTVEEEKTEDQNGFSLQPGLNTNEPPMVIPADNNGTGVTPIKQPQIKEEDSVLEFNFLYFLIQKFKLSEIME